MSKRPEIGSALQGTGHEQCASTEILDRSDEKQKDSGEFDDQNDATSKDGGRGSDITDVLEDRGSVF